MCLTYEHLILATGARERLLPFEGWTLPGVTGAGALQALIKGGMPVRGERVVIAGSGPLLIAALATARAAGARVLAVVEQASGVDVLRFGASLIREPAKLRQALSMSRGFAGVHYWTGSLVEAAHGEGRVQRVTVRRGQTSVTLDCDRIACGFGLAPNVTLARRSVVQSMKRAASSSMRRSAHRLTACWRPANAPAWAARNSRQSKGSLQA